MFTPTLATALPGLTLAASDDDVIVAAVAGGLVLGLMIVFFLRSRESRKTYSCPRCGEQVTVELMEASRCNSCGAPLDLPRGS